MDLKEEAKQHFKKMQQYNDYLDGQLDNPQKSKGQKYQIKIQLDANNFIMQYAREALRARGITV